MRKCSECEFAKFTPGNGSPGRYYCENPDARFVRSECEPVPMICRTGRHDSNFTIKTSPKWCPFRKSPEKKSKADQTRRYISDKGFIVFVSMGISKGDQWMTVAQKSPLKGTHRVKSPDLPIRSTREEAQRDLDAYAARRKWKEYTE